ncbi:MAG: LamG domain-containing protein [Pseudomonadota bacterium]
MIINNIAVTLLLFLAAAGPKAAPALPQLNWRFDEPSGELAGNHRFVPGVDGSAVFFDGYTTVVRQSSDAIPDLTEGFTIVAWLAIAAYPWGQVPIVNQGSDEIRGLSFDLTARGALRLKVVADGRELVATSEEYLLAHRRWTHVAARFDPASGLAVFLDGRRVAEAAMPEIINQGGRNPSGRLQQASDLDLLIGATREPVRPAGYHRFQGSRPGHMSLDGLLDELSVFPVPITDPEIRALAEAYAPGEPAIEPRVMPSGPPGPGRFGAYQTTLKYHPEWDALSRVGDHADVIVRFDSSSARVVFWRGTQYSPAWVTGNGLWMADQSVEGYDDDYTWEHMNDKHNRYSQVRVIENHDARVVVHWRYAPVDVHDRRMNVDERSEMGAWVDEYYSFYPDAMGVRRVSWTTDTLGEPVQFQESIPLLHPGQVQGDLIEPVYATVGNLEGETGALAYTADASRTRTDFPENLVIQMHHFRSEQKPFIVFEPGNRMTYLWDLDERSLARPGSSSHWPVGKLWSDGRTAQAPDRATSFLGFPISEPPITTRAGRSEIRSLYGMTDRSFEDLVTVARAWSQAPSASVMGDAFESLGFDRAERVFRFARRGDGYELNIRIDASDASPLHGVPILIENWGDTTVTAEIDGAPVQPGERLRVGHVHALEGTHLVVWLGYEATSPIRIRLSEIVDAN